MAHKYEFTTENHYDGASHHRICNEDCDGQTDQEKAKLGKVWHQRNKNRGIFGIIHWWRPLRGIFSWRNPLRDVWQIPILRGSI